MTRLFTNSDLLSKLGECNIYYISINIYILYLGLENTTLSNQNFISNKKIYTLMFWSGNCGNRGNWANKVLKLQQSLVPTFGVFGSHSSHFPFCLTNLTHCFLRIFSRNLRATAKFYSTYAWRSIFALSVDRTYAAWRRFLFLQPWICFLKDINKPPGNRKNEYFLIFYVFLYFFLEEIKNDRFR